MHGGTISAASPGIGKGSVFTFELPGASTGPRTSVTDKQAQQHHVAAHILVVDDNRDAADSLAEILRLLGFRVHTAYDGATALVATEKGRPRAVFLDIGMPDMDGPAVLRGMRQLPGGSMIFAIAATGYGTEDEKAGRADFTGFNARLQKPVGLEELRAVLVRANLMTAI